MKKLLAIISIFVLLFSLTACRTHTYAETYSYDAENHWRQATCEHTEEKGSLGSHKIKEGKCSVCGYTAGKLLVKTAAKGQKYVRTQPIHELLMLGFSQSDEKDVQWVSAKENNIESYTIGNGAITVTVSAVVKSAKYTSSITVPLDESPIDVEAFFAKSVGEIVMLRGIVAGFSTTSDNNEVVLSDKQTGRLVSVFQMGEGKLLYGGYALPDVAVGDEIIIPVEVLQAMPSGSANSAKWHARYAGGIEYQAAVVSKNNALKFGKPVVMTCQADLEEFLSADNRESNLYKMVKLKGNLNFKLDSYYENYNFWFGDREATASADIKIDNLIPTFSNPAVFYTTGIGFSELVFGTPHKSTLSYAEPLTAQTEITAVFLGGDTGYAQFLVLDRAWVVNS